MLQNQ